MIDPNQERATQAAFHGYVRQAELNEARAEIGRLRATIERATALVWSAPVECEQILRHSQQSTTERYARGGAEAIERALSAGSEE